MPSAWRAVRAAAVVCARGAARMPIAIVPLAVLAKWVAGLTLIALEMLHGGPRSRSRCRSPGDVGRSRYRDVVHRRQP